LNFIKRCVKEYEEYLIKENIDKTTKEKRIKLFIDFLEEFLKFTPKEKESCIKIFELILETGLSFDDICLLVEHIEKDCLQQTAF